MNEDTQRLEEELRSVTAKVDDLAKKATETTELYAEWMLATERKEDLSRKLLISKEIECVLPLAEDVGLPLWDSGAPRPCMLYSEQKVQVFYSVDSQDREAIESSTSVSPIDAYKAVVTFSNVSYCSIGKLGDEGLKEHRYYKEGLEGLDGGIVVNSNKIAELKLLEESIEFKKDYWRRAKHFVFCFKDVMAEIVATDFTCQVVESDLGTE